MCETDLIIEYALGAYLVPLLPGSLPGAMSRSVMPASWNTPPSTSCGHANRRQPASEQQPTSACEAAGSVVHPACALSHTVCLYVSSGLCLAYSHHLTLKAMMAAPSSTSRLESGGMDPGAMPPTSAWWPRLATKKTIWPEGGRRGEE